MTQVNNFPIMISKLEEAFTKRMEFTKPFNFQTLEFNAEHICLKFAMRKELQGNILQNILHGGVAATVLDTASGMVAIAATFWRHRESSVEEQLARIAKAATVDLRIDYLRPGRGEYFLVKADLVRQGNKITVVDSALYNESETLLARGVGTYLVGS